MRRVLTLTLLVLAAASTVAGCSGDGNGSGSGSTTGSAAPTTTTKPTYGDLRASDITLNPVLEIVACDGGGIPGATTETTGSPDDPASTSSTVASADGKLCYVLGPAGGDGADLRDAKAYADGVGIEVTAREDSVEALNRMLDACFEATDECPAASVDGRGYVAIVIDGRVASSPAVNAADLASSPFVLTGDFDNNQAKAIAAAINGS